MGKEVGQKFLSGSNFRIKGSDTFFEGGKFVNIDFSFEEVLYKIKKGGSNSVYSCAALISSGVKMLTSWAQALSLKNSGTISSASFSLSAST